jgi:hypothetical protein
MKLGSCVRAPVDNNINHASTLVIKIMRNVSKTPRDHLNHKQPLLRSVARSCCVLAAFVLLLGSSPKATAQSDNFDSGTLSTNWNVLAISPLLYSLNFPTFGTGKALRIQGNPYPDASFPAAVGLFQTNLYTNFYEAVDVVNWVVENQAIVVFARFTPGGSTGLDEGTGMIFNYDVAQDGDGAGDRNGGEMQINTILPGFTAGTKAAAEITLVPGHSYRFVFKCVGQVYTGQVYDWQDLTTPLVTLQFNDADSTFTSGECGLLSFSRDGIVGTTDVTIDNYYAAATDPNLATPPALMHPVPGTPIVATRSPVARWQNFYNPASGISFTAKTYTTDVISSAATKLLLNGVDFSSQLILSADGTNVTGNLPGSALKSNSVYSAQISLADTTGLKTSVNTFWFDTFSDAYLASASVKTIECEDYNYSNGVHQLDPIPVSGMTLNGDPQINGDGVGYYDLQATSWQTKGTEGVDFHCLQTTPDGGWTDYRQYDGVRTGEGLREEILDQLHMDVALSSGNVWDGSFNIYQRPNDNTRQKYGTNLVEYLVVRTQPGDWLNYTRSFASSTTNYFAFLRVGSFGPIALTLSKVTSDPTLPNQTTSDYGTFSVPNQIRRANFSYIPVLDANDTAPVLGLSGVETLRLTVGGTVTKDNRVEVLNYLLLVPAQVTLQSSSVVSGPYADEPTAALDVNARTVSIATPGASKFYRLQAVVPVKISGISVSGGTLTIKY